MLKAIIFWYFLGFLTCMGHVTFTNLKCTVVNKAFGEFTQCHIKAVNRTHKYVNIYVRLDLRPLENVKVNIKLFRYDNGYKPFFVDISIDGCKFMKNQRHPLFTVFYQLIRDHSNINHTCPYDHDIIVDKLWTGDLDRKLSKLVPIPPGDYLLYTKWYSFQEPIVDVNYYVKVT